MAQQLDYGFSPTPHALVADMAINHGAVRLWAYVSMLKWNHLDPEPELLAEAFGVDRRTVFRWLTELEKSSWATWTRYHSNASRRIVLRYGTDEKDKATLAQLREMFQSGTPDVEQIRRLVMGTGNEGQGSEGGGDLSGESDPHVTSDMRITSDIHVTSDPHVTCDPHVTLGDPHVTLGDPHVTLGDIQITECDMRITCDPTITSLHVLAHSDASNLDARDHGGGGSLDSSKKRLHHHRKFRRGADATITSPAEPPTESELWMLNKGASLKKAHRWRHLSLELVQREYTWRSQLGQGWGAIFGIWEKAPPTGTPEPQAEPASTLDPAAIASRARRIAPADVSEDELGLLMSELSLGATEDQALDRLAFARYQAERAVGEGGGDVWTRALVDLRMRVDRLAYTSLLQALQLGRFEEDRAILLAPTLQIKTAVESRFLPLINDALSASAGRSVRVGVAIRS